MATIIVDIETVGYEWEEIPKTSQEGLTKWIHDSYRSPTEKEGQLREIRNKLSLSPLTGRIVSIAMYDLERELGAVYFASEDSRDSFQDESFTFKTRTEKELLEDFWDGAVSYDTFVTFNGRAFLFPFLYHRSIINGIKPSIEIAKQKYVTSQNMPYHVDLLDEFTFYGSMKPRPSLQILADAYGIDYNPKLRGEDVGDFFREKKFTSVAKRNAADVMATKSLYEIWKINLAPRSFLNSSLGTTLD